MPRDNQYETMRATELEGEIGRLHGGRTRADYTHGDFVRTVHHVPSSRMLTIALVNSGLESLPAVERDMRLDRVGKLGLDWLRARSLLVPATLVSVTLSREIDLKLVSWGWGVGGRAFWVDNNGSLTTERPA